MNVVTRARPGIRAQTVLAAAFTIISWASIFPVVRFGLRWLDPFDFVTLRIVLTAAILGAALAVTRARLPPPRKVIPLLICGVLGVCVYNLLLSWGLVTVTAGAASVLTNTIPIFTALLSCVFNRERLGFLAISGMSMSLAGVAVIGADQPGGLALGAGTSLILFAALCSALFIVLQRRLVADLSPFETASWFMIAGAACMLPFSGHALTAMVSAPPMAIGIIVFLAVCPGALGQVTWLHVVKAMPAGRASSLLFLVPPLATLLGAVTLGESITNALLVGGSLAILGVILVQRSGNAAAYDAAGADLPHTDSFSHNSRP